MPRTGAGAKKLFLVINQKLQLSIPYERGPSESPPLTVSSLWYKGITQKLRFFAMWLVKIMTCWESREPVQVILSLVRGYVAP